VARIRSIDIRNFRCLQELVWHPSPGVNCLIGPGDMGKSSVLDAIDLCLGARRIVTFGDDDFFELNVAEPISISITVGELDDNLKSLETYGNYLRSFDPSTKRIDDEPAINAETVLTLNLTVKADLEPIWTLTSDRTEAGDQPRYLTWGDRNRLCPTKIGRFAESDLAWRRGSVLTRLSDEKAETSGALADAARQVRKAFGDLAEEQLTATLAMVNETANELGIDIGKNAKALLDAHSVSFSGGTISLHNDAGVPLRGLGTGSARLLVAGLQRKAAKEATVVLIDEAEYGLEPHRIIRLLQSIGSKDEPPPVQAFITTHSPVVVRELSADQLTVLGKEKEKHVVRLVSSRAGAQGATRSFPEAFLASSVIVCEGASEVGLLRGLDQFRVTKGAISMAALGVALVDAQGVGNLYKRANAFSGLGYRTTVLRDDDEQPSKMLEGDFIKLRGPIFRWRDGRCLEDELLGSIPDAAVSQLVDLAVELHGQSLVNDHIVSISNGESNREMCQAKITPEVRGWLLAAATTKSNSWFKTVGAMERVGREIVGPALSSCDAGFGEIVKDVFGWIRNG
jgi:putative ATP-dependent endonuclease of the OLD family